MTAGELGAVEARIAAAIEAARANGIEIGTGAWGVARSDDHWAASSETCCALGCALIGEPYRPVHPITATARALHVPETWIESFITGWDASGYRCEWEPERSAFEIGRRLRERYTP